jgi:hypothetical protein
MIVIENLIRINRIEIEKSGFKIEPIFIPTCWNCFAVSSIFKQPLIEKSKLVLN